MALIEQEPFRRAVLVEPPRLLDAGIQHAISLPSDPASPDRMMAEIFQMRGLAVLEHVQPAGDTDSMYQLQASPEITRLYGQIQRRPDFMYLSAASAPLDTDPRTFKRLQELLEPLNPINQVMRTRISALYWSNRLVALEEAAASWDESIVTREKFDGKPSRLKLLLANAEEKNKKIRRFAEKSESGEFELLNHDDEVMLLGRILDAALGATSGR